MSTLLRKIVDQVPDPAKQAVPDSIASRISNQLRKRDLKNPTEIPLEIDGQRWTMLSPSVNPWEWHSYPEQSGCHEPITTKTLLNNIDSETVFWDIGAHIGYFSTATIALTDIDPSDIHVFEPDPIHAQLILKNAKRAGGGDLQINEINLGEMPGEKSTTGDRYAEKHGAPDIIKIDAGPATGKGNEDAILGGMESLLKGHKPMLLLEIHSFADNYSSVVESVKTSLEPVGYSIKICYDHYSPGAEWSSLSSVEDLPQSPDTDDYMLLCE